VKQHSGVRRVHRLLGFVTALGLLVLTTTGLGLLYPRWTGPFREGFTVVAADPVADDRLLRAAPFRLEESRDGGSTWQELPLRLAPSEPVALVFASGNCGTAGLLGTTELLVSRDGGAVWEAVALPGAVSINEPARGLAVSAASTFLVTTDHHAWVREAGSDDWREIWSHPSTRSERVRIWTRRLHTGHWGPAFMVRAYGMLAFAILLVIVSGTALAGRRNGRNGNGHRGRV